MVSTRGHKYKFTDGERVLCYEPDPTKAKVLYDSKVLEVIIGKDERGRKNVEYLIHFQGWNSSWDRCVSEDYVLKDTEENRKLQKDLADKAQLQLGAYLYRRDRKKRTRTLSQKINDAWESGTNSCSSKKSQGDEAEEREDLATSTEDDDDDEDDEDDEDNNASSMDTDDSLDERIPLDLSSHMKTLLEEDYNLVNRCNKIVILPASPTVLEILESYVRHCGVKSPRESEEKSRRRGRGHFQNFRDIDPAKEYETMIARLNLCKEIADGLRIYFDFTLGQLLLYDLERAQYEEMRSGVKEFKREIRIPEIKMEPCDSLSEDDTSQNVSQSSADMNADIRIEAETIIDTERKRSLRSHREPTQAVEPSCSISQPSSNSNNGIGKLTIKNLGSLGGEWESVAAAFPTSRGMPRPSGRVLASPETGGWRTGVRSWEAVVWEMSTLEVGRDSDPLFQTDLGLPPGFSGYGVFGLESHMPLLPSSRDGVSVKRIPQGQTNTNISMNNHCSTMSTSSTSSYYSPLPGKNSSRATSGTINAKVAKLMDFANSWKIVPQSYLEEKPPHPSTLYGAVHLARLFVKLPNLLYIANQPEKENQPRVLPERKLKALIHHLQLFLSYLESKPEWFGEKHYMDNIRKSEQVV